jgi:hypothetical protein
MGCGASKSKGGSAQREIASPKRGGAGAGGAGNGTAYEPPPAATIPSGLTFTWLRGRPSGQCSLTVNTLSAKFESDTGPVILVGLGQFSRGRLSWKPRADRCCARDAAPIAINFCFCFHPLPPFFFFFFFF